MKYSVIAIPHFKRELKRLSKKFPSLRNEFAELIDSLELHPSQGQSIGNNCFKVRIAIASKGKGKSGGGRVITYIQIKDTIVYLLSIYDKSEQQNISDKELQALLKLIP